MALSRRIGRKGEKGPSMVPLDTMKKKVLVIGSGGREHALAWKLAQSPEVGEIYVAPGNGGTKDWNVPIKAADIAGLVDFAREKAIDLTVVGPEDPLNLGIVDAFKKAGLRIFGPSRQAAQLEGSKAFAKRIMDAAHVPTARWAAFADGNLAKAYIKKNGVPCVVKADGLAAGKGVIVAAELETALAAVDEIMEGNLGLSGRRLIVEEYLTGPEVSLLCFVDGKTARPMVGAQDHKRALDGDQGLNTGGMGTISPPKVWNPELESQVMQEIIFPTLDEMDRQGIPFQGVLFCGLMLTEQGPKVLEYNVRFGDPETQVVLMRLKTDLFPILWACTEGTLSETAVEWKEEAAVCVVMASPGYPGTYAKGIKLELPETESEGEEIFHAGTEAGEDGIFTSGGRVLGATACAATLKDAQSRAYALVERIGFPGAHFRRDIGGKR